MPTVIVLDTSMSMLRPVSVQEPSDESLRLKLAIQGVNTLLDHLSSHSKLEFVSLVAFSSTYEIVAPFTRDFESLRSKLQQLDVFDCTDTDSALQAVDKLVLAEWGATPCQVILVSDGQSDSFWNKGLFKSDSPSFPGFNFPCKLSVMCIAAPNERSLLRGLPACHRLAELSGSDSAVYVPAGDLSEQSVKTMFQKLAEANYTSFQGTLKCGNLGSHVVVSPSPRPYVKVTDFETVMMSISDTIEVCGFMDVADVGSPAAISRHLILPHFQNDGNNEDVRVDVEADAEDEPMSGDGGKAPSFCVLLHGALKVENMAAICRLDEDWFGVVYSWADSKKKSNLMLTILEPGSSAVPWLGDLNMLGAQDEVIASSSEPAPSFPVRPIGKKSYSQNCLVWIRCSGIQADLQKILRHARKLPDKTHQFYKELNRVRKAALSLGFEELLDGMAAIFERECALLPGGTHPDCALQLTHAAGLLRKPYGRDIKNQIIPLQTNFLSGT